MTNPIITPIFLPIEYQAIAPERFSRGYKSAIIDTEAGPEPASPIAKPSRPAASCAAFCVKPHSAVIPLQIAQHSAVKLRRLARSAMIAAGMPSIE